MGFLSRLMGFSSKSNNSSNYSKQHHELPQGILGRRFSLAEIKMATDNFNPNLFIGEGGFGKVYKGCLVGGVSVAIKRLSSDSYQGIDEFKKEVLLLLQIRHPNLVSIIGSCNDKKERIIVYDYMVKAGSLDIYLFDIPHSQRLSWKQRLRICIGIAGGIHYLHTGSKRLIIHGDLKPNNILLDGNFIPKLSDFRLSKIGPISMSRNKLKRQVSRIIGTYGYMPPEFMLEGIKTEKVDVYSFGIILLEVLVAKRINKIFQELFDRGIDLENRKIDKDQSDNNINRLLVASIEAGTIGENIDPSMISEIAPKSLQIYLKLMQDCLAYEAVQRPSMGEVEVGLQLALHLQEITPHAATEHVDSGAHGANHNT